MKYVLFACTQNAGRGDRHSDDEIRACADPVLAEFQDAPVRSFVMSLAQRKARDRLRADRCELAIAS